MNYELNEKSILSSLKPIIVIGAILIVLFLLISISGSKLVIFLGFTIVIFLILAGPQILLIYQYKKATNYTSLKIDYEKNAFFFDNNGIVKEKKFEEMKSLTLVKASVLKQFLSPMLMLSGHFYYYKVDFGSESYYVTSLLDPKPKLRGEKDFYKWYIEKESSFANIKNELK